MVSSYCISNPELQSAFSESVRSWWGALEYADLIAQQFGRIVPIIKTGAPTVQGRD